MIFFMLLWISLVFGGLVAWLYTYQGGQLRWFQQARLPVRYPAVVPSRRSLWDQHVLVHQTRSGYLPAPLGEETRAGPRSGRTG